MPSFDPAASPEYLVRATGITVRVEGYAVVDGVELDIARGEIVTLIGLNGSGKTTLVRVVVGLVTPDEGTVRRAPGLRIGYSPQHLKVDPTLPMTVQRFLTLGASAPRRRLEALLDSTGAGGVLGRQVAELSGGELHRVLLARALAREPDLLVLDEPLAGVDVAGQTELYQRIADIRDEYRCGVLLVSHDLHMVMAATDTVVCVNHHVCCTGHPESVARNPEFISLFGRHTGEVLAVYTHRHDHAHDARGEVVPLEEEPPRRDLYRCS